MSPSPRIFATVGLLLLPVGVWWALDGRDTGSVSISTSSAPSVPQTDDQWERERVFQETFDIGAGGTLNVDVRDADVEVRTGTSNQVVVEAWISARDLTWGREVFQRSEFRATRRDRTVHVEAEDPRVDSREWRRNRGVSIAAVITVPAQFNVLAVTGDGDIDIASIRGNLEVRTSDGDVTVEDVTGDNILIDTSDGDVRVMALSGREVRIETSDGDINLRSSQGPLTARTSDGDIVVRLDGENTDVTLSTGDGDITIFAPTTVRADVAFEGEDVEISQGFELRGTMGRRTIRGTLNGGGGRLSARTGDGEIALRVSG